jgi:hypothetical protein
VYVAVGAAVVVGAVVVGDAVVVTADAGTRESALAFEQPPTARATPSAPTASRVARVLRPMPGRPIRRSGWGWAGGLGPS